MSQPTPLAAGIVDTLVEQHRWLLDFLARRVGSRIEAEEILQSAFVRSIESAETVRNDESVIAWFHRLLRKAFIDHHRRQVAQADPSEEFSREVPDYADAPELPAAVRTCVGALLGTLRSEYGTMLRRVDLGEEGSAIATEEGISADSAAVRLHRARLALRQRVFQTCRACVEHGCLDCECKRQV